MKSAPRLPAYARRHALVRRADWTQHTCHAQPSICQCKTSEGAIKVEITGQRPIVFAAMGSGLLWARSTGLKVWPGAMQLAHVMNDMELVLRRRSEGVGATTTRQRPEDSGSSLAIHSIGGDDVRQWSWQDKIVVELGCGLGLCSVIAARLGAKVKPEGECASHSKEAVFFQLKKEACAGPGH